MEGPGFDSKFLYLRTPSNLLCVVVVVVVVSGADSRGLQRY